MRYPLGNTSRYWLKEIDKRAANGLLIGDYTGTSHSVAIEGLINLGYCKVKKTLPGNNVIVEITSTGKQLAEKL